MPAEITMPKLGLTMTSGIVGRWYKRAGDAVREGEPVLEVSTDKINYEVEAGHGGVMLDILAAEGEEYPCGAVLAVIRLEGESGAVAARAEPGTSPAPRNGARTVASPAARKLARERSVRLNEVRGSGPRGRVTLADVRAHAPGIARPSTPAQPASVPSSRRVIFERMTAAASLPLAHVEHTANVDELARIMRRRGDFGWTAFFVYAVARALRAHPVVRTDASSGLPFERIDIGVAADTESGLIVPVVRRADELTLAQTQERILHLAEAARKKILSPDDLGGACFSLSNVGPQKVERVVPLVDPPQTAILGLGAASARPAVVEGAVVSATLLTLVVSFDHRFIDGAPAARFLADVVRYAGDPATLL